MTSIQIELVNLLHQKITEVREANLALTDTTLSLTLDFDSEIRVDPDDELLGWKEEQTFLNLTILKKAIIGVDLASSSHSKRYVLSIHVQGDDDIRVYFKKQDKAKALALKESLLLWILS